MDNFNLKTSKKPCFPKTIVTPTKGVSPPSTDDNMIQ
jgi:hypothetical protein